MILKYMHEPVASSSSDKSLREVENEEAHHERLLSYETMKSKATINSCCDRVLFPLIFCGGSKPLYYIHS